MADTLQPDDIFELKSALQILVAEMRDAANGTTDYSRAVGQQLAEEEERINQTKAANKELKDAKEAFNKISAAGKAVAKEFMSIADAGAKLSATLGVSLTRGTQLELSNRLSLLGQLRNIEVDRMATMQQIQAAEKSFVDVLGGARKGMEISAKGATEFASRLKAAAGGEFTMTATAMQAMITAGIGGAQGLEKFKNATGLRSISEQRFAQLVNKNSLSFMLYGPRFAKAANEAEKLGISLASVQSAQESMVTNLDGTLDTLNQVNQLGAQIDFGTLTRINEFEGPQATLKYLQSTIPPALFQSASTRALLKGFGVSVEDLMKGQNSAQKSAADKMEAQLSKLQEPVGTIAKTMALLGSVVEKVKNSFGPLIVAVGSFGLALLGARAILASPTLMGNITKMFPTISKLFSSTTGLTGIVSKIGSILGRLAGPLVILYSLVQGFRDGKASGRSTSDAAGGAAVRGGLAVAGFAIGGPIGAFIGDAIGKAINKYIPNIAASVGELFRAFGSGVQVIWGSVKELFSAFGNLANALFGGSQAAGEAYSFFKLLGGMIKFVADIIAFSISGWVKLIDLLTRLANWLSKIPSFFRDSSPSTPISKPIIAGNDVISRSGYGDRTLTTPNGSVALNNRDTVVAFADDMISGVRTLSLGSIARQSRGSASDNTALVVKVDELIRIMQTATTVINIDNKIQQVPRNLLAGVNIRNDRV